MRRALFLTSLLAVALAVQARAEAPANAPIAGDATAGTHVAASPSATAGSAAPAAAPLREIVQQRLPDGRIVLTDRPLGSARTLRTWQYQPEDAQAAAQRRAAGQRESAAVSERIARQLAEQRETDRQVALARAQASALEAEREAARARLQADPPLVFLWPRAAWRPDPPHRPGARPPFGRDPHGVRAPYEQDPFGAHAPFEARSPGLRARHDVSADLPPHPNATPPGGPAGNMRGRSSGGPR